MAEKYRMKVLFTRNSAITGISIILILALWGIIARSMNSSAILPGPWLSLKTFIGFFYDPNFYFALGSTLLRGLLGFVIALLFSLAVGIPSGLYTGVEAFFAPILVTIRSIPVISVILLALIWFRIEQVPVFIGFLTMFPILTTNLIEGIRSMDSGIVTMARVYKVKKSRIILELYLPGIIPFIYSGLITAIGFGWRAIIIGEVLSQPRFGIGTGMQEAQSYLLVADLISWTIVAVIVGFCFEVLIRKTIKPLTLWYTA